MRGDVVGAVFSWGWAVHQERQKVCACCAVAVLPNGESPTRRHPLSAKRGSSPSSRSFRDSILAQPITTVRFVSAPTVEHGRTERRSGRYLPKPPLTCVGLTGFEPATT
jgi:hypothetical protein